jgi:hypothetical protein
MVAWNSLKQFPQNRHFVSPNSPSTCPQEWTHLLVLNSSMTRIQAAVVIAQ